MATDDPKSLATRSVPPDLDPPPQTLTPSIVNANTLASGDYHPVSSAERYVIGEEIARGGMGEVYRATDSVLNREVAVKVLHTKYSADSGTARRFHDEARITGQLQHPGIPPVHDLGVLPDGRPFLAMKLIKGQTLEYLLQSRPDPAHGRGQLIAVFEQICQAVAYAHAHGVIHRDLKPQNVMVGSYGEVQVMDWGLAKVLALKDPGPDLDDDATAPGTVVQSLRESDGSFTQVGSVLGTPAYMPPEQAIGAVNKIDARSDVFGLGGVLAVILTGKPPFTSQSRETTRVKAAQGRVQECFERLDGCGADPELVALAKRCLAPDKEDRPTNAGEVALAVAALRQAADERARQAELDKVKAEGEALAAEVRVREQRKRRRTQAVLGLSFTAFALTAGAFAWWQDHQANRARQLEANLTVERALSETERVRHKADREAAITRAQQATEAAIRLASELRRQFRYADALRALDQAEALIPAEAPPEIQAALADCRADTILVRDLDEIRFSRVRLDATDARLVGLQANYRKALHARGLDPSSSGPAVIERIVNSPVRQSLAVALTDWLGYGTLPPTQAERVAQAARRADPGEWIDRIRTTQPISSLEALKIVSEAPLADLPPQHIPALLQKVSMAWPGSAEVLAAVAARHRSDFWVQFEVGYFFIYKDYKPARAIGPLQAALAIRPDCVYAMTLLSHALQNAGYPDQALVYPDEVLRLDPNSAWAHRSKGWILDQHKKDWARAEKAYREALRCDPTSAWCHDRLGWVLQQQQDWAGAERAYRRTVELDPKHPTAWRGLGDVMERQGNLDEAMAAYQASNRNNPKDTGLALKLGSLQVWFVRDKHYNQTVAETLQAAKDTNDPKVADLVSKLCCLRPIDDQKMAEAALGLANRSVELGKKHSQLGYFQMALGIAQYRNGLFAQADATLAPLAESQKNNAHIPHTVGFYRAMALFRTGKVDQAKELANATTRVMRPLPADDKNPLANNANADDLIIWLAYREAKALIQFDAVPRKLAPLPKVDTPPRKE